jgi:sigma-E factor negative regulatory protein RseC
VLSFKPFQLSLNQLRRDNMQEVGRVVNLKEDRAIVRIGRGTACDKCDKNCPMAEDSDKEELLLEVANQPGAEAGQQVKLETESKNLVSAILWVYLFPLIGILVGYSLGILLTGQEWAGIIGGLLLFLGTFLLIKLLNPGADSEPQIIEVIE